MAGKFHHEELYRGAEKLSKLTKTRVVLCGAGALGSNIAENLARQGFSLLRAIDHDRVEEHNVSTQAYGESDIGVWKVEALRNKIFRATGVEIDAVRKEMTAANARSLLREAGVVLDLFDNSAARKLVQDEVRAQKTPCLHVGLYADYCEVIWDEQYRVPRDVAGDVCDYPLARNLVLLATTIASEALMRYVLDGEQDNWSATLGDFGVRPIPANNPCN